MAHTPEGRRIRLSDMADKLTEEDTPTQETPEGYEIPVPSKEAVFGDLEKATKPPKRRRLRIRRSKKKR